jgi:ribonuclease J
MARKKDELVFCPLGGAGEIGMNLGLYGFGPENSRKWIMVDLGVTFADATLPGIDVILPDIRFIEEQRDNLLGIFLTHAHEDHFGAVIDLWPRLRAPVYATPFSAALLRAKIIDERGAPDVPIKEVPLGGTIDLGPFEIEFVSLTHSIPEPNGLIINTSEGSVFHTGDWKIDDDPLIGAGFDRTALERLGKRGCRAIICDSTNVFRNGVSPTEGEVAAELTRLVADAPKRVCVTSFASNVARLRSAILAADRAGRSTVLAGRSMYRMIGVAVETGYLGDIPPLTPLSDFSDLPRNKVLVLMTGSQGEPRAALARIANENHPDIQLSPDDQVIFSSRTIPGNERSVSALQNALIRQGVKIITDADGLVHVSGHPRRGELEQMYKWVKPELAIPVHGETRHLHEHARFAKSLGVPETQIVHNGDMVKLAPGPALLIDEVPAGRIYRDGRIHIRESDDALGERRKLSYAGIVVVSLALSEKGQLAADPDAVIYGIPEELGPGIFIEDIVFDAIDETWRTLPKKRRRDPDVVAKAMRGGVRSAVTGAWGKRTVCEVIVNLVP